MSELTNERDPAVPFPATGPLRLEGVGTLEAARSVATGQRVCVRRVPGSAVARSAIEAALRIPRHPALSAAIDSGTWEGAAWIATEFPEGQLLGDCASGPKLEDFAPIAEALAALHAHGVPHGLVSGEAVLISAGGQWMLHEAATLELNRLTDRRPEQTALAQLQRTAGFSSPQRLKGGPPTTADDVYALGALLCIATGGERLVRASALEQLHAVMLGDWKPRPADSLPPAAARLITRMISADPAQRPSAKEVGERLRTPGFVAPVAISFAPPAARAFVSPYAVPAPAPTAPGFPVFDFPRAAPTAPDASPPVFAEPEQRGPDAGPLLAPPIPPAPPTVPTPRRAISAPLPARVQLGGAATRPSFLSARLSAITVSIAASDARLVTAGLLAIAMLASTVALGAHVVTARQEAEEVAAARVLKPVERKEPRYNAEQLKQILRQKEEARHEY